MPRTGRPSEYTKEQAESICRSISQGSSVQAAAKLHKLNPCTVFDWLLKHDDFANEYTRARKARADSRFERIDQIMLDMREGKIDAAMARVEVDAVKWQCGKEAPAKYGDRLELAGDPANPVVHRVEFVAPKPRES